MPNLWRRSDHAGHYLDRADRLPHRFEGEGVLVGDLSDALPGRILDLGCGDGRLTETVLRVYPGSAAVCVDLSPTMLEAARDRMGENGPVVFVRHNLDDPLPGGGVFEDAFDAVVSSFAIHHVDDARKRSLYAEVTDRLAPGGILANLDIVASPTPALHARWREEMGAEDDPSDLLCDLPTQLDWFLQAGLTDVDCIWKWRSLSLFRGRRAD